MKLLLRAKPGLVALPADVSKSIFLMSSARMPCAANARRPRSSRTSIWCSTKASGTSNSLRFTSSATSLSLASCSTACFLLGFHTLADALYELHPGVANSAQLFGEVVVKLGSVFCLIAPDFDGVAEGLTGQTLVIGVRGINHVKGAFLTGGNSAQVFGELRHGVLAADFDQNFVHVDRLGLRRRLWACRRARPGRSHLPPADGLRPR